MRKRVLIVGGGPAGMAAALAASKKGADVTLLERRPKPGKKLLATGNGRCNLANRGKPVYFGDGAFAENVLSVCPPEDVMRQFEAWGLPLYTDPEGRVYPAVQQASSVLSVLTERMRQQGVRLVPNADVIDAVYTRKEYVLTAADGQTYTGDCLILAAGGLAGGGLGNRPQDYALATGLGHHLTPLFAGLAPIELEIGRYKRLSGLRVPAYVTLVCDQHTAAVTAGEVLFTDYGISGICVMQLARKVQTLIGQGRKPEIALDFTPIFYPETRAYSGAVERKPDMYQRTLELLQARQREYRNHYLTGLIPDALAAVCPSGGLEETASFLTSLRLRVSGVRPMQQAQITCGGIDTAEVDPLTMASRLRQGLYFAGEMLNVDGDCGGYNLQFAFASGLIAGKNAAE